MSRRPSLLLTLLEENEPLARSLGGEISRLGADCQAHFLTGIPDAQALAPLLARALLRLSFTGSRLFYLLAALLLLHMGIFSLLYSFEFSMNLIPPQSVLFPSDSLRQDLLSLRFLPMVGAVCLFSAILLTRFTRRALSACSQTRRQWGSSRSR